MPRFGLDPVFTGTDDSDLVDIPTADALRATAADTFRLSPTVGAFEAHRLQQRTDGVTTDPRTLAKAGRLPQIERAADPKLPAEEAKARIAAAGLTGHVTVPATGIPAAALDLLIDIKAAELRNAYLADRYRGGVAGGAAQLGTALAVSLADPVNIGSAFVPVVGEARYARLLERAGPSLLRRATVRGGVGALEGSAGAALLEPLVYTSQQQLQADYGTFDSLMNVGFGAVFGGLLHPAAGGVGDLIARRAGLGVWAESTRGADLDRPDLPATFLPGGGTRWIDGEDYARGQFALVEADRLASPGRSHGALQVGEVAPDGPHLRAGSGAPVMRPDGSLVDGSRRIATIRDAYAAGQGDAYRAAVLAQAGRLGFDPAEASGLVQPVLVRVEGAREVGVAKAPDAPPPRMHPTQAADLIDAHLAELRTRAEGQAIDLDALAREDAELEALLRDHYRLKAQGIVPANGLRDGEVAFAEKRRVEIRNAIESHRTAVDFRRELERVTGKLAKLPDNDAALVDFAEKLRAKHFGSEQAATALRLGVAQAVNGAEVNVAAVAHLDGSPAGVERFLEARAQAESAEAARLTSEAEATAAAIAAAVDVSDAAKLDADVKALEADIRAQVEATGGDVAALDAALAEADELAAAVKTEAKALQGAAMCLERT